MNNTVLAIFAALNSPGGEIGRRTVFRSQRLHGCAGSNPVLGTKPPEKVVLYLRGELIDH